MKRKILSSILVIGLICTSLTGCASFSYGNPVKAETYVAESPDGEMVVLDKEEAEELQRAQDELQEELGISDEELEELREDIASYEESDDEEEVETTATTEDSSFNFDEVFGSKLGSITYLGGEYKIYENGSIFYGFTDDFGELQKTIEYEGTEYPVIGMVYISREDFIIPDYIKYITPLSGDEDYYASISTKNIVIPDTVEYINARFSDNVENVTFPESIKTTSTWKETFVSNDNITSITIPEGVVSLELTFLGCDNLSDVSLPSTLKEIGHSSFESCVLLSEISLPDGITKIGGGAFANTAITNLDIPKSVTSFSVSAVEGCPIEKLIIPDTVLECSTYVGLMDELKTIEFPNNATYKSAEFEIYECPKLESVIFPDCVQDIKIHLNTLENPSNLTIYVPENTVDYFANKYPEINVVAKE